MFTKKEMVIGTSALLLIVGMNLFHAIDGYGFLNGNLCQSVWAQGSSSGSSSSGSGSSSSGNTSSSSNSNSSSSSNNGEFTFGGSHWNTDESNSWGSNWKPVLTECTHTATSGIPPFQVSVTYKGKMVVCQSGNGNCFNGTSCVADPI